MSDVPRWDELQLLGRGLVEGAGPGWSFDLLLFPYMALTGRCPGTIYRTHRTARGSAPSEPQLPLIGNELGSGEAASVDAPSLDMEGRELQILAFVLSTRDVSVAAADRRLTNFPALDLSAADPPDRSGR
jgi:hypothetical protein